MSVAPRQTSTVAVLSLVLGIAGWTVLPFVASIVAIITGHMARAEIRRRPTDLEGDGLALTGLILGWLSVGMVLLGILAFIAFFGGLAWLAAMSN
ncbi:hypothetical protein C1922_09040 [Stenotrophomonas sp. ZAC14D2_NAIMI4_7]|uniref:DUF4190 domain-containing protein n=1 Tax=Stenotrophomonas sp. ZAC14D2_NAIMI4_7 TaxID=2072405 RepID=UPI000D53E4FF|nr:DUF4190 domain-containing protein [Stenotrophomonas sp. ZAC14D2_NAIMI4_7]AWH17435.1 hypothetical protein C1922_09040 [Stenotrophomonas sp. ZAC14D2_NAIMI4_7]